MMRLVLTILFLSLVVAGCSKDDGTASGPPTITKFTPAEVVPGQQSVNGRLKGTNFTAILAVDLGPGIKIESVKVVDSGLISVQFSVAMEAAPGARVVSVFTPAGLAKASALNVSANQPPLASFTVDPPKGSINSAITFDASGSSDPDGTIQSYEWSFGDGQAGTGNPVSHQFGSAGTFQVNLKVTDDKNASTSTTQNVQVETNRPPVAHFDITPHTGDATTAFHLDGSRSTDNDGHITSYLWDFGDGSTAQGKIVQHQFTASGSYSLKLTVTDNFGLEGSLTKDLEVKGLPPIADFSVSPESGDSGTTFQFDGSASSDPDGTISEYHWDFGDNLTGSGKTIQHKFQSDNSYPVRLTVMDNGGLTASQSRTVRVGADGIVCKKPVSQTRKVWYGEIVPGSVDTDTASYVMKFYDNVTCDQVFYKCGDVRLDPFPPKWGDVCKMVDLGNNMFRLYVEREHVRRWPEGGEKNVFLHWQACITYCSGW